MYRIAAYTCLLLMLGSYSARAQFGASRTDVEARALQIFDLRVPTTNWRDAARQMATGLHLLRYSSPTDHASGPPRGLIGALSGTVLGGGVAYAVARGACEGTRCSSAAPATLAGAAIGALIGATVELVARR